MLKLSIDTILLLYANAIFFHFLFCITFDSIFVVCFFTSFLISCNSKTSADTFCECRSTPGDMSTSQANTGFGLPPSLMQANISSEFSLTGTKIFPASRRRESMSRYGGFGRSKKKRQQQQKHTIFQYHS